MYFLKIRVQIRSSYWDCLLCCLIFSDTSFPYLSLSLSSPPPPLQFYWWGTGLSVLFSLHTRDIGSLWYILQIFSPKLSIILRLCLWYFVYVCFLVMQTFFIFYVLKFIYFVFWVMVRKLFPLPTNIKEKFTWVFFWYLCGVFLFVLHLDL